MPIIDLGKVVGDPGASMRFRGEWNSKSEYFNNASYIDAVTHNGSLWICKVTNTNQAPAKGNYWEIGAQGAPDTLSANNVTYDNTDSGLTAQTVQEAIDENAEAIRALNSRTTFAEYRNIDLNTVNEYCFVVIDSNSESYNAPAPARYLCTPQAVGFQIGVDMNAGNFYARGHNWGGFSDWRNFSFS